MEIDDILSEDEQPDYWDSGWAHEGEKLKACGATCQKECWDRTTQNADGARKLPGLPLGGHAGPEAVHGADSGFSANLFFCVSPQ